MKKGDKVKCVNPGNNDITLGQEYDVLAECTVLGYPGIRVMGNTGSDVACYQYRFEVVSSINTLEDDIQKGKSLIGKKVQIKGGGPLGTVEEVYVALTKPKVESYSVEQEFEKFGYAVVLKWGVFSYGLSQVEATPDVITLPLTKDYEVHVYADKVVVGCQTITKEALDKVVEAMAKLNQ